MIPTAILRDTVTVEPHTEQNLWDTLAYIRETNLLDHPGGNL